MRILVESAEYEEDGVCCVKEVYVTVWRRIREEIQPMEMVSKRRMCEKSD